MSETLCTIIYVDKCLFAISLVTITIYIIIIIIPLKNTSDVSLVAIIVYMLHLTKIVMFYIVVYIKFNAC